MSRRQRTSAYLQIAAAMTIVGSSVVTGKWVTAHFPVFLASGLRFLVASLLLVPLLWRSLGGGIGRSGGGSPLWVFVRSIGLKGAFVLFLQALFGVFLFNVCLLYGLKYTSVVESGILTSTIPAAVALLALCFLREKMSLTKGLGVACAVLGTLSVNLLDGGGGVFGGAGLMSSSSSSSGHWAGNLLILGSVSGEAMFIILGKAVSDKIGPLAISTAVSVYGLLLFLPFSAVEAMSFPFSEVTLWGWGLILYNGVVVTVLPFC